jgi:hypothetical protein
MLQIANFEYHPHMREEGNAFIGGKRKHPIVVHDGVLRGNAEEEEEEGQESSVHETRQFAPLVTRIGTLSSAPHQLLTMLSTQLASKSPSKTIHFGFSSGALDSVLMILDSNPSRHSLVAMLM